jgi:hypothetical protein
MHPMGGWRTGAVGDARCSDDFRTTVVQYFSTVLTSIYAGKRPEIRDY